MKTLKLTIPAALAVALGVGLLVPAALADGESVDRAPSAGADQGTRPVEVHRLVELLESESPVLRRAAEEEVRALPASALPDLEKARATAAEDGNDRLADVLKDAIAGIREREGVPGIQSAGEEPGVESAPDGGQSADSGRSERAEGRVTTVTSLTIVRDGRRVSITQNADGTFRVEVREADGSTRSGVYDSEESFKADDPDSHAIWESNRPRVRAFGGPFGAPRDGDDRAPGGDRTRPPQDLDEAMREAERRMEEARRALEDLFGDDLPIPPLPDRDSMDDLRERMRRLQERFRLPQDEAPRPAPRSEPGQGDGETPGESPAPRPREQRF